MSLALLLALVAIHPQELPEEPPSAERPVLRIEEQSIPFHDFANFLLAFEGEAWIEPFALHHAARTAARKADLELKPAEIEARLAAEIDERVNAAFGGDREAWAKELRRPGIDESAFRARRLGELESELWLEKLAFERRRVTQEQVRSLFEQRYGPGGRQLWVRALRLRAVVPSGTEPGTPEQRRARAAKIRGEVMARAHDLYDRLQGGEDFETLARAEGDDLDAVEGNPPWDAPLIPRAWLAAPIEQLWALQVGEVAAPFFDRGHANLFRVHRVEQTEFEPVEGELRRELQTRRPDARERHAVAGELRSKLEFELRSELAAEPWQGEAELLNVNGAPVSREEFAAWMVPRAATRLAELFVQHHLLEASILERGLAIDEAAVSTRASEDELRYIGASFGGDRERWRRDLTTRGRSPEGSRWRMRFLARLELMAAALLEELDPERPPPSRSEARGFARDLLGESSWKLLSSAMHASSTTASDH